MNIELVGYIAAICTSMSFLPQAIKVIRYQETKALSLSMYAVFTFGVAMWLFYGFIIDDVPMILANSVTLVFALTILVMKILYRSNKQSTN